MAQVGVPVKLLSMSCKLSHIHVPKSSFFSHSLPPFPTFTNTKPSLHVQPHHPLSALRSRTPAPCKSNKSVGTWETRAKRETGETGQWHILDHSPQHWRLRR
ncbi:unnamed protein product [Sphenostylis stenocarpa]|uniref:Uncharacterized protein n=1 Tax=Sphenostylis stenocarpa TaxID=92480 RepID=A0AA86T9Z9_9FABA|nr:unnamed protein product [Sphenostylis stenocarpa]